MSSYTSFLAMLDAAVSTRAQAFLSARGNFDRAVVARRALRGVVAVTLDSVLRQHRFW